MDIKKVQSALQVILTSRDINAKKDIKIIISTLEKENEIRFEIALNLKNEIYVDDLSKKFKKLKIKRQRILEKYGVEPF